MIKSILAKNISSIPDTIQFGKDRKWEEAWIVKRNEQKVIKNQIADYLSSQFTLLTVEFIWNSDHLDELFVLSIFLNHECKITNHQDFIQICLELFYEYKDFDGLIENYESEIIGFTNLFENPVEAVTLGIFNHWLSVGPVDLWNNGEELNIEDVSKRIKDRPEVERSKLNFQGLLFMFNFSHDYKGPAHGIKTPCCVKKGDEWVIDLRKIEYWMRSLISL